ncbi:MAG: hypothetical protein R6U00_03440 [Prochlorococcaceae cyanobacterium]
MGKGKGKGGDQDRDRGKDKAKGKGRTTFKTADRDRTRAIADDTLSALQAIEQALPIPETPPPDPAASGVQDPGAGAGAEETSLSAKDYERRLRPLHVELVKLQEWVKARGVKVCILFEGRDGAGKGGTIKAITERVSPRVFRVVALPTPSEREQSQLYMQRYVPHLPAAGEVVIFDRSWYNRAVVEPVMGYCSEAQAERFLLGAPLFERILIENDIHLLRQLPYEEIPREPVELPRRTLGRYQSPDVPRHRVPELF